MVTGLGKWDLDLNLIKIYKLFT